MQEGRAHIVAGLQDIGLAIVIEVIFQFGSLYRSMPYILVEFNPESIEKPSEGPLGIDIANDNHIASFIEVADNILHFDLAGTFYPIDQQVPLADSDMTMTWSYLKRS